jgi:hypothetical protein
LSAAKTNVAEVRAMLTEMAAEAQHLEQAAGGSITDTVAGWLAPQYALAARKKLASTDGAESFKVLRMFVQDWAMLRHGDHTAARLQIERDRVNLSERDAKLKWRPTIEAGLGELGKYLKNNPDARIAYERLKKLVVAENDPQLEKEFREWLKRPEIRREVLSELMGGLSPETLKQIEKELPRP